MKNFRIFNLAVEFYKLAKSLPLRGALKDQLGRASSSIALNLAEGRGKDSKKDQRRFFHIAMGSVRECQAILMLSEQLDTEANNVLDSLGAHLYRLIQNAL